MFISFAKESILQIHIEVFVSKVKPKIGSHARQPVIVQSIQPGIDEHNSQDISGIVRNIPDLHSQTVPTILKLLSSSHFVQTVSEEHPRQPIGQERHVSESN